MRQRCPQADNPDEGERSQQRPPASRPRIFLCAARRLKNQPRRTQQRITGDNAEAAGNCKGTEKGKRIPGKFPVLHRYTVNKSTQHQTLHQRCHA